MSKLKKDHSTITTFTCPPELILQTREVLKAVRRRSQYRPNRSRLLQAALPVAIEACDLLDYAKIHDHESFCCELRKALRSGAPMAAEGARVVLAQLSAKLESQTALVDQVGEEVTTVRVDRQRTQRLK